MTIKVLKQRKIYKVVFFYFSGDLEYKARHSGVNPNGNKPGCQVILSYLVLINPIILTQIKPLIRGGEKTRH